jgi:uncharacterized protein YaaQ
MKMIVCIIQEIDKDNVLNAIKKSDLQVTVLPSTGGYFRKGNITLLIGTDDETVDQVINKIKINCQQTGTPEMKPATVFVLDASIHEPIPRIH